MFLGILSCFHRPSFIQKDTIPVKSRKAGGGGLFLKRKRNKMHTSIYDDAQAFRLK